MVNGGIVDNQSLDDSLETLRTASQNLKNVHLIAGRKKNGGFGYGNNQVIDRVMTGAIEADFLYFLNNTQMQIRRMAP